MTHLDIQNIRTGEAFTVDFKRIEDAILYEAMLPPFMSSQRWRDEDAEKFEDRKCLHDQGVSDER